MTKNDVDARWMNANSVMDAGDGDGKPSCWFFSGDEIGLMRNLVEWTKKTFRGGHRTRCYVAASMLLSEPCEVDEQ